MKVMVLIVCATVLLTGCAKPSPPLSEKALAGRQIYQDVADPPCGDCHTLADAGSLAEIGPNLDELGPSHDRVVEAVTSGVGIMPSQTEILSSEQIEEVARYVVEAAGG